MALDLIPFTSNLSKKTIYHKKEKTVGSEISYSTKPL
jgi:hypothetical protein